MADSLPAVLTPAETNTELAFERTRLAAERTLMAWVRTSASLISFGFGIDKFIQGSSRPTLLGPHTYPLIMIGVGLGALSLGIVEYRVVLRSLSLAKLPRPRSFGLLVAGMVLALGVLGFIAVLWQL